MSVNKIIFEKVIGSEKQLRELFALLLSRKHSISHGAQPTFCEHKIFVLNQPYRVWYLVRVGKEVMGSAYITNQNSISVYLIKKNMVLFKETINFLVMNYKPLREIKSIRPNYFYINVSTTDLKMMKILMQIGCKEIQSTFKL